MIGLGSDKRHWQLIWSKLGFYFSSGITLDIDVFFLWRTSYWSIEDKTYKQVEKIPSRHALENLPEKSSINAFIHLKRIGNVQGFNSSFWQYIMADMLNLGIHLNIATSGEKIWERFKRKILLNDYDFWHFPINPWYMRVSLILALGRPLGRIFTGNPLVLWVMSLWFKGGRVWATRVG